MSAGAEDDDAQVAPPPSAGSRANLELVHAQQPVIDPNDPAHPDHPHHPHHILIEPQEDRWKWRRKIRQDPRKLFFYRWAVAVVGFLFIALGIVTGPLPGPGGIPLVLLGLAVWSSEFEWAHKVMQWFKAQLHRYQGWSRGRKAVFWVCFFAVCGALGYLYLVVIGFPTWLPQSWHDLARRLPGVG